MPAPKGHEPYAGCEKGAAHGYKGKPQDAYTEQDLHRLGKALIDYMNLPESIWYKGFLASQDLTKGQFDYLKDIYPIFSEYVHKAKMIQETKIATNSFWKKGDANFGKFMLARHHEDWKEEEVKTNTQQSAILMTFPNQESLNELNKFMEDTNKLKKLVDDHTSA